MGINVAQVLTNSFTAASSSAKPVTIALLCVMVGCSGNRIHVTNNALQEPNPTSKFQASPNSLLAEFQRVEPSMDKLEATSAASRPELKRMDALALESTSAASRPELKKGDAFVPPPSESAKDDAYVCGAITDPSTACYPNAVNLRFPNFHKRVRTGSNKVACLERCQIIGNQCACPNTPESAPKSVPNTPGQGLIGSCTSVASHMPPGLTRTGHHFGWIGPVKVEKATGMWLYMSATTGEWVGRDENNFIKFNEDLPVEDPARYGVQIPDNLEGSDLCDKSVAVAYLEWMKLNFGEGI